MYILTEDKQSINLSEQVRVQAQHGSNPKYSNRNKYGNPYVRPWKNKGELFDRKWALCINVLEKKNEDEKSVICVAVFDNVQISNSGLNSVRKSIELKQGWDASVFKEANTEE